ncbi:MAG: prephenate dehydratase, partial [Prochlorococcaceae cyanobacterium ETNP2_MAG_10]|nr:prephenate dehydratase [Prochlorococcaceae cyanobacterium ETNP2_MAG_10]
MPTRVAFLGPEGTYGDQAARALAEIEGLPNLLLVPCVGMSSVVEHVVSKR